LCVIRSKKTSSYPSSNSFEFSAQNDVVLVPGSATSNALSTFTISGISSSLSANPIVVSLDETQASYITKIIGKNPMRQNSANEFGIYVEAIYPHFLRQNVSLSKITNAKIPFKNSTHFSPYLMYSAKMVSVSPFVLKS
jgi:hypothetical protein